MKRRIHFFLEYHIYVKAKAAASARGQNFSEWLRGLIAEVLEVDESVTAINERRKHE